MTPPIIQMTEDEFDDRYPLVVNTLNPNASWCFDGGPGCLFETHGEELEFVRRQDPRTVWTLIDGDDGDQYLTNGFQVVNRIGYLISTVTVPGGMDMDIEVRIPIQPDPIPDSDLPARFDDYEIGPCRRFREDGERDRFHYEPSTPDEADVWTLYGHVPGEGVEAIGDFETCELAEQVYARITGRRYGHQA